MKVGLYSITYLGIWYRGGALGVAELFAKAREMGYSGVELDGKRPHANPMDLDAKARAELKRVSLGEGTEICAVAANNDFTSPVSEHRECQLLMARELVRLAADLGAPVVRLFAAWPGVTVRADGLSSYDIGRRRFEEMWRDSTRREAWLRAQDTLAELAPIAEAEGVTLALQNHAPVIETYQDMVKMVHQVGSPALRACLDAPGLPAHDAATVRQAVLDVGDLQAHSHFGGEFRRDDAGRVVFDDHPWLAQPDVDNLAFVEALRQVGYDGYLCYEFCHLAIDPEGRGPLGRAYVDAQAALACEHMTDVLRQAGALGPEQASRA